MMFANAQNGRSSVAKTVFGIAAFAATVAATSSFAGAAQASTIWTNENYQGASYTATFTPNVGSAMNDKASSMKNFGQCVRVYENANYLGRSAPTCSDYNALNAWTTGLSFPATWGDRITSWERR